MTLHAVKEEEVKGDKFSNENLFYCDREELVELVNDNILGEAFNYRIVIITAPVREKTKGGLIKLSTNAETEASKTSVGRIVSKGSTVGDNASLRDCKNLQIGDYVKFQYYAAGLPDNINNVSVKYLVDDQVICRVKGPDSITRLYDL